jgi:hypothetical protein
LRGRRECWHFVGAIFVVVVSGFSAVLTGQGSINPRVAALQFAVENGLERPQGKLVVAHETNFAVPHPPPSQLTETELRSQAEQLAAAFGPGTLTGRASDYLACPGFQCSCTGEYSVLLVTEALNNRVYIRLYSPAPADRPDVLVRLAQVIVDVEKRGTSWVAVGSAKRPATLLIRR